MNDLNYFELENWKIFKNKQSFAFPNISLLVGTNNSGKSSLVEAIKYAQILFKDFKYFNTQKDYLIGQYGDQLKTLIEISLSGDLEYFGSFKNLVNFGNNSNVFSFTLEVNNGLFPKGILLVNFCFSTDVQHHQIAFLKQITIRTTDDEILTSLAVKESGLSSNGKISYSFPLIYNYAVLKKYYDRASEIQVLIDEIKKIITYEDYLEASENLEQVENIVKRNRPEEYKKIVAFKKALSKEFSLNKQQIATWREVKKVPKLFFEYAYFTKNAAELDEGTARKIDEFFLQKTDKSFIKFKKNFLLLAENIECVIFEYLWEKQMSLSLFIAAHEGINFIQGYNELGEIGGLEIVNIAPHDEIFEYIVKKLTLEKKIANSDDITLFFSLGIMLAPDDSKIGGLFNELECTCLKQISNFKNFYFTSYKAKKLSNFYTFKNNDLGLDERIFQVFSKGQNVLLSEVYIFINRYLNIFNIGEKIKIIPLTTINAVSFEVEKNKLSFNITSLGYGSTNILILLLSILSIASKNFIPSLPPFRKNKTYSNAVLFIEEPEANLHPALQSKLADLILEANKRFNIQFVIETHSEYLIRKLQYFTGKGELNPSYIQIYYFYHPEKVPMGEEQVKKININIDGSLTDNFGGGFFDEATSWKFELLKLNNPQKN